MALTFILRFCLLLVGIAEVVQGHGYIGDPPARNYVWTYVKNHPDCKLLNLSKDPHYSYTGLNCGGTWYQSGLGGKCGACGDKYDQPRLLEKGGKSYSDDIVKGYFAGCRIAVKINFTAFHKGWVEFRLCHEVSEKQTGKVPSDLDNCFSDNSRHVLLTGDTLEITRFTSITPGLNHFTLQLPKHISCNSCVLQWKYHAGNNAGNGPQEEFYNCATVAVYPAGTIPTDKRLMKCNGVYNMDGECDYATSGSASTDVDTSGTDDSGTATGCGTDTVKKGPIVSPEEGMIICELLAEHSKHRASYQKCCKPTCSGANKTACEIKCLNGCPRDCTCKYDYTCTK